METKKKGQIPHFLNLEKVSYWLINTREPTKYRRSRKTMESDETLNPFKNKMRPYIGPWEEEGAWANTHVSINV